MFLGFRTQHINFWPLATGRETPHPVGRPPPRPGSHRKNLFMFMCLFLCFFQRLKESRTSCNVIILGVVGQDRFGPFGRKRSILVHLGLPTVLATLSSFKGHIGTDQSASGNPSVTNPTVYRILAISHRAQVYHNTVRFPSAPWMHKSQRVGVTRIAAWHRPLLVTFKTDSWLPTGRSAGRNRASFRKLLTFGVSRVVHIARFEIRIRIAAISREAWPLSVHHLTSSFLAPSSTLFSLECSGKLSQSLFPVAAVFWEPPERGEKFGAARNMANSNGTCSEEFSFWHMYPFLLALPENCQNVLLKCRYYLSRRFIQV